MQPADHSDSPIESAAVQWLACRDRGLSPSEQDAYLLWLQAAPAHGVAIARLERSWARLDTLRDWQPAHSTRPNPDLLAPRRRYRWIFPSVLAAAAALTLAALNWWSPASETLPPRGAVAHPKPERLALEDGSLVELNTGAKIELDFTANRRGVRLLQGEAHFVVAKDTARPFVVVADTFSVRAVGTAFAVRLNDEAMSVLVTEGKVQLDELSAPGASTPTIHALSGLVAGQEATVRMHSDQSEGPRLQIREVTPAQIEEALAWQTMHLEFVAMPLREVVAEFNRYNSRKLVIEDPMTGDIVVGGSFRADNVEPFVRLLDLGFGVSAYPRGHDIVLRRRR